jgi:hypothetical protein
MWNSARKQSILSGRALLRITRPDIKKIIILKRSIWASAVLVTLLIVISSWPQIKAQLPLFSLLLLLSMIIIAALLTRVMSTQPVIFTEEGIMQKWNKAVLWSDMDTCRKKIFITSCCAFQLNAYLLAN